MTILQRKIIKKDLSKETGEEIIILTKTSAESEKDQKEQKAQSEE